MRGSSKVGHGLEAGMSRSRLISTMDSEDAADGRCSAGDGALSMQSGSGRPFSGCCFIESLPSQREKQWRPTIALVPTAGEEQSHCHFPKGPCEGDSAVASGAICSYKRRLASGLPS